MRVRRRARVAIVGDGDGRLQVLLAAALADIHVEMVASGSGEVPDLVLAVLDRYDTVQSIIAARVRGRGAPVIAVLPLTDTHWERAAQVAGAARCWALDTPMSELKTAIISLLA